MKCKPCGDTLKVIHTENTSTFAVKRHRYCGKCHNRVTTYEREADKSLNEREQKLIDKFRKLSVDQSALLWAFLGLIDINGE